MDEEFNFNNLRFTEKELEEHIEKNLLEKENYFNFNDFTRRWFIENN